MGKREDSPKGREVREIVRSRALLDVAFHADRLVEVFRESKGRDEAAKQQLAQAFLDLETALRLYSEVDFLPDPFASDNNSSALH